MEGWDGKRRPTLRKPDNSRLGGALPSVLE